MLSRLLTNHPLVNILFTVVVAMGLMSYFIMPREQDPEINFYWVNISTVLPGASAEDVEKLVTSPLEDSIKNVQDISFTNSTSRESISNILVRFRDIGERNFDKRINDLRREIQNKASAELPDDADDPLIIELTTSNGFPTALVVVTGQADDEVLRSQARKVKEDLEGLRGVDQVTPSGLHDPELHVEFDPDQLAAHGLNAAQLAETVRGAFRDVSAGSAKVAGNEWLVRVSGTTDNPDLVAQIQLPAVGGSAVTLDSLASIARGREDASQLAAYQGKPAVSMAVTKVSMVNTLQLVDRINAYIDEKNKQVSDLGIQLILADDQTIQTRSALAIMQTNAGLGLILVLFVCWLFLGFKIAFFVTLGIVFSITGTLWILNMTGNTLNVSVLLGIVIVLGMLVDDAVVVVEAIFYRMQRGADALTAALESLREVGAPVTAGVLTTMAAFLPLMLLPGILGAFMFVIPFVVTLGLAISLIEAFWILPSHVIGSEESTQRQKPIKIRSRFNPVKYILSGLSIATKPTKKIMARGSNRMQSWRHGWTRKLRTKYTQALCFMLRRPYVIIVFGILCFFGAINIMQSGKVRSEFFTFDPFRLFYVNVDMPSNTPLEQTLAQTIEVEKRLRQFVEADEVRAITSLAGIKFTEIEILVGDQYGQIQVSLMPKTGDMRSVSSVVEAMRETLVNTPGDGIVSFLEISGGPPAGKPVSVKVRSDDFVELRAAADAVKHIVETQQGSRDVADNDVPGRSELVLELNHQNIRNLGLDPATASRLLRLHLDGEIVALMRDEGEKVEMRVRAKKRNLQAIDEIMNDPVALPNGGQTTLGHLFTQTTGQGRSTIKHYNLRRAITVEAEINPELTDTPTINADIVAAWDQIKNQYPNTDLDFSGELDDVNESLGAMGALFLLGLGLIYLILATQLRSYFQPFLILVTVPMAFTGVVFGLFATNNPLSLYTLYGIIALTGIAVNGAIVLIDAANERIKNGKRPLHATIYAARRRVVPIIMTTTTTIAGLFSLAAGLGGKSLLWGPVASSIVFGLAFSSLLTLFMVPVLYRQFMKHH
ncbi:efflux RND transporter permease subunit [Marinicella litoralis]|uniref:Multidrug efflux pump subunit AcrB n=1 Tax=Marinicella litoralis TaxID=644220 RepID=A0A4R6XLC5_9GAMM|nr:efflux RND transporter permease subunit [Marinicella litoralis]TDR20366.1 multidrug efflux pump subunit AcrB [Marinicella litoralis]